MQSVVDIFSSIPDFRVERTKKHKLIDIITIIAQAKQQEILSEDGLEELIQSLSLLTDNDYRRLKLFLQRVQSL